jgi:uncharacterized protein (TIGR00266 family)
MQQMQHPQPAPNVPPPPAQVMAHLAATESGTAHQITHGPSFAMLRVDLQPGQTLIAEAGAMVAKHQQVAMQVKMNASPSAGLFAMIKALFIALIRKFVGGETFIVNHFSAPQPGSIWLAPSLSGQISHRRLNGESLVLSTGAYLGHVGDVNINMKFGGLKGLLAKEGAFFLEISGHGDLWFTSYGGIEAVEINGSFMVDNGHLVGYEGNLGFNIKSAGGGMMGFMASGEGLVCEFNGQGRVYVQSRNLGALASWLGPLMP